MRQIKTFRVATGAARREGRDASHDGEYITVYYRPGSATEIVEDNGGAFALDEQQADEYEDWDAIRAEARERAAAGEGAPLARAGSDAKNLMIELGWAGPAQFDDDHYFAQGV